jgi:hypothetical protein
MTGKFACRGRFPGALHLVLPGQRVFFTPPGIHFA